MKLLALLASALISTLLAVPVWADTIINFDDLPQLNGTNVTPLTTYDGFTYTAFDYFSTGNPGFTGVVSNPNAALTTNVNNVIQSNSGLPFTFVSAFISNSQVGYNGTIAFTISGVTANGTVVGTDTITPTAVATKYTFNFANITHLVLVTTNFTSFDNLDLIFGSNLVAGNPGLNPNQQGVAASIDNANAGGGPNASLGVVTAALLQQTGSNLGAALDELTPVKFNTFSSTTAFNNESFETAEMDSYLANQRGGEDGGFLAGNGHLDTKGLTVNDPNVDPGLQMIHSRMLAWDQPNSAISDVPGAVLGGIDMKDAKQMKSCGPCSQGLTPWDFFVRGNVVLGQGLSQGAQPHFDDNTESVVVGADYHVTSHFLAGLTASYAHTDATLDTANSSATVDSYSPGVYASYANKGWFANLQGRYSYNSYTESRNISFLNQTAYGGTDGNEGTADLDGGYEFHNGPFTYGPVAGVQYTHLTLNSYTEQGSAANLNVNEDQTDSLRSRLGGSIRWTLHDYGVLLTPHLTATWQHEFLDSARGITSQFTQFSGGSFTVRTEGTSDDFALVDAGLDAQVNDTISVFGDYLLQAGQSTYFGQSVQAGVNVRF